MKILFIGDVHGKFNLYKRILKNSNYPSFQIGDMGVGFRNYNGDFTANPPYDLMVEKNARFIRGNHDNPNVCRNNTQWIKDGTIETTDLGNKIMYVGGAYSIDRSHRREGYDWWSDEQLSYEEFMNVIDLYKSEKPNIMVTHDCPENIACNLFPEILNNKTVTRTGQAFQVMLELHRPDVWIFGHYHSFRDVTINNTRFVCLGELETLELEI